MNVSTEIDHVSNKFYFSMVDYIVFGLMLLMSALTGIYHGCRGRKHLTTRKYLMGSNMQVFPVAMSLIASYVSGVTILGTPAEVYNYGTQYWIIVVAIWIMGAIVSVVYLPVFTKLKVNSSYEYLEVRFDSRVRTLASMMFVLDEIMFLPILIYVPALAFNQVTGINIHLIGSIVCIICIFYTVVGGLKAVVWTDTLQIIVMFFSVIVIVFLGTVSLGGPIEVFKKGAEGGRLIFFNFDGSMYTRHTVWSVLIGGTCYWTAFNAVNQTMVQRYMSLQSLKMARRSLVLFTVGVSLFVFICCYSGLLVFAAYKDCDPLTSGLVQADDQILPVFVMQAVGQIPGLPGLFIAGVFGAALSSLSVVLNSTATVLLEDFTKSLLKRNLSDKMATVFAKSSVLVLGAAALGFLFVVEHLGGVLSVATSLSAIAAGTSFGVFSLGMLVPWCNTKGALAGAAAGALMSGWVSFGSQYASASGNLASQKLHTSTDSCEMNFTIPFLYKNASMVDESHTFPLYRLSYHWITPVGVCSVLIVGMVTSLVTGRRKKVNPDLLSPVVRFFMSSQEYNLTRQNSISYLKDTQDATLSTDL